MGEIEITPEDLIYMETVEKFHNWKHTARSVQPQCEETIRNLENLLEHFSHCFKEGSVYFRAPKYPEALCKKLRKELEDRVKLAQDVEKTLNQLIEEGTGYDVHGDEFDTLLDVMKDLATLESKLSRIIGRASYHLELSEGKEGGQGE